MKLATLSFSTLMVVLMIASTAVGDDDSKNNHLHGDRLKARNDKVDRDLPGGRFGRLFRRFRLPLLAPVEPNPPQGTLAPPEDSTFPPLDTYDDPPQEEETLEELQVPLEETEPMESSEQEPPSAEIDEPAGCLGMDCDGAGLGGAGLGGGDMRGGGMRGGGMRGGGMGGGGMGGGGMGGGNREAMQLIHKLLQSRYKIRRTTTPTDNGVKSTTTSDDPVVAGWIQQHVMDMLDLLDSGGRIREWDPLFAEVFDQAGAIETSYDLLDNDTGAVGINVTEEGFTDCAVDLVQLHADVVSAFIALGQEEVEKTHEVPESCTEGEH